MTDDRKLTAALARLEQHFARQSEIMEATTARMETALAKAQELRQGCRAMAQTLDRLEGKNTPLAPELQ